MTPVAVSSEKALGKPGLLLSSEYTTAPVKFVAVNAVVAVMAVPTVPLTVCEAGESEAAALTCIECAQQTKNNRLKDRRTFK